MRAWRVALTVRGPLLTRSTAIGGYGLDAPLARDLDHRPIIAGSHIKGKLRQALDELAFADKEARRCAVLDKPLSGEPFAPPLKLWFGDKQPGDGDRRGLVLFGEFRARDDGEAGSSRVRIGLNPASGIAADGALQAMETPYPTGTSVAFDGRLVVMANDDRAAEIAGALQRGLNWIPQLGGERTIGFGSLLDVTIEEETWQAPPVDPAIALNGERVGLVLRFLEPFCLAASPREDNLYVGEAIVPGGVIKGALANQIRTTLSDRLGIGRSRSLRADVAEPRLRSLRTWFDRLRISHLKPWETAPALGRAPFQLSSDGRTLPPVDLPRTRPQRWPLSLAYSLRGRLCDLALSGDPAPLIDDGAPAFALDWKSRQLGEVEALFGLVEPPRQLRLRTAMDPQRRSAKPEDLFAYEVVMPDRHLWVGELDLSDIDRAQRADVIRELLDASQGLICGIGKSDATAQLLLTPPFRPSRADEELPIEPFDRDRYVLTLQTPALLCTGDELLLTQGERFVPAAERLRLAYFKAFAAMSDGKLELVTYFARQRLAGGEFLWHRYQSQRQRQGQREIYRPWLLTEPGSVFVLKRTGRQRDPAEALLRRWLRQGLPLPPSVRRELIVDDAVGDDWDLWQLCPFIRQNGYGEIAVNLDIHATHRWQPESAAGGRR